MAEATDFEELYRSVMPRLVSLGLLKTGRRDVATELAQETMLRAHDRWHDVSTYEDPAAWCGRVMVNLLIDHHRRRASERRVVEQLEGAAITADTHDSNDASALRRWNELVAGLNDRQRLVVTLYYADDWSVGEISAALATTQGAVKATLFKARRRLRSKLSAADALKGVDDG